MKLPFKTSKQPKKELTEAELERNVTVELTHDDIILMVISGEIGAKQMDQAVGKCREYAKVLRPQGKPVLIYSNSPDSTAYKPGKNNSEFRNYVKNLDHSWIDRMAINVGNQPMLALTIQYILSLSGVKYLKIYTNDLQCRQWLVHGNQTKASNSRLVRAITFLITLIVSGPSLARQLFGSGTGVADVETMSALIAMSLLPLSLTILLLNKGKKRPETQLLAGIFAVWALSVSVLTLLLSLWHPVPDASQGLLTVWRHIGQFGDFHTPLTSVWLLLASVMALLALSVKPRRWQQHSFFVIFMGLVTSGLYAALTRAVPLSVAAAFAALAIGLSATMKPTSASLRLNYFLKRYWQAIILGGLAGWLLLRVWRSIPTTSDMTSTTAAFVVLGLVVFLLVANQGRLRHQMVLLAARMTEDLSNERNKAVAVQQKDEAILGSIADAVFAIDTKGHVTLCNLALERMCAVKADEVIGKPFDTIIRLGVGTDKKSNNTLLHKLTNGGDRFLAEESDLLLPNGKSMVVSISASAITMSGKVTGAIVVLRDITHEKEVDRMKTEFISLASHQLRTPLSAIKWFGEMLLNNDAGKLKPEQSDFVKNMADATERMIELVNGLLNVSRIESGRIVVDPRPTDLKQLVQGIVTDLSAKIDKHNQTLLISVHDELPKVNIDPGLIGQVYLNLLTNAIKYSPKGGEISVVVSKKDNMLLSQVSDNGYGIPEAQQGRMFQKFFRADNITKIETDGTGLGLYLVKAIVETSGGKIWFKSKENEGTTFWFTIPLSGMKARKGEVTLDV